MFNSSTSTHCITFSFTPFRKMYIPLELIEKVTSTLFKKYTHIFKKSTMYVQPQWMRH